MSSYGKLQVGWFELGNLRNGVENELLAAFRDDMLVRRKVRLREYYPKENVDSDESEDEIEVYEFCAEGSVIADRLDALGVTADTVTEQLEYFLHGDGRTRLDPNILPLPNAAQARMEAEESAFDALTPTLWIEKTRAAAMNQAAATEEIDLNLIASDRHVEEIGSLRWMLSLVGHWFEPEA